MQGRSGDLFGTLLPWLGGLLAVAFVGVLLMAWTRRMAVGKRGTTDEGFGLEQLQRMMERGEISPEEFDRARRKMIERVKASALASRSAPPSGKGR